MSAAYWITGDTLDTLRQMPDGCVDLVLTSPPFLALRSYLPADDPAKGQEIGQESTPGAFLDVLLDITEELRRVLAPHGSIAIELGDTYSGSGGGGGDYSAGGMREGQVAFDGSGKRIRATRREGFIADGISPPARRKITDEWPMDKSLCLIPEIYRMALAYGRNPLTGRECSRWRIRNVVRWVRPNPPVGALGDKYRPATSEMVVATMARDRYFDLDAVREPGKEPPKVRRYSDTNSGAQNPKSGWSGPGSGADNPAGAPPLDWWEIPTHPYVTPDGLIVVPAGGTSHRVRVPVGVPGDGIQRTTSPSCPVHGSQDRPGSSVPDGGRAEGESNRTGHTDSHPALAQPLGSAPTQTTIEPLDGSPALWPADAPAAKPRSTSSRRTDRDRSTSPAGTPSAQTPGSTDDTSASPESSAPDHGTPSSRTSEAGSGGSPTSRTTPRTAGTGNEPATSEACTCSYWVEVDVAPESTSDYATIPPDYWNIPTRGYRGSHYATYPEALCERPIKSMVPQRVCTVCGKPSERITSEPTYEPSATNRGGILKRDGERAADGANQWKGEGGAEASVVRTVETLGWSDCGHDAWRTGRVLDIFAGSGTTLAVATGHGRDAIGIDLDARNVSLARDRIGMFLTEMTFDELREVLSDGKAGPEGDRPRNPLLAEGEEGAA